MKDEKKKYLIIDGSDIYPVYSGLAIDSEKKYSMVSYSGDSKTIINIFKKYDIPEMYQKIIIQFNTFDLFFIKKIKAQEFLTDLPFLIEKQRYVWCEELIGKMDRIYPGCRFITTNNYWHYNDVIKFYYDLRKKGLLKNYIYSLKEILQIDLDLNFLLNDEYFDMNFLFNNEKNKIKKR